MPDPVTASWSERWQRLPWWLVPVVAWSLLIVIVSVLVYTGPTRRTVYPVYDKAGQAFLAGQPLYGEEGSVYRYAPFWAVIYSAGVTWPAWLSGLLWRLLSLALCLRAAYRFQVHFFPAWSDSQRVLWWLLLIPFCYGSFSRGQANILLLGLLLESMVLFSEKRFWICCWCLALAISLKIFPIALALLLILLQPVAMIPALLFFLAFVGLAPYAFQSMAYVTGEYRNWYLFSASDLRVDLSMAECNRDGWQLARLVYPHLDKPDYRYYQVVQAITALALAVWTWFSRQLQADPASNRILLLKLYNLATIWMLVMGPSSESATYSILAPITAMAVILALSTPCSPTLRWLTAVGFCILFIAHVGTAMTWTMKWQEYGIHPLGTLVIGYCLHRLLSISPQPQTLPSLTPP